MNRAHIPTVSAIRANMIASHLLHRVDTSQLDDRDGVSLGDCIATPACVHGFGDNDCDYPSCVCYAMPIKEPRTQEEHAEHLEATRSPTTAQGAGIGIGLCLISAIVSTLAILSTPDTLKAAIAFLGL